MALTATYDPTLNRMRISATALGATATTCFVWRSLNGFITYTVVRGAQSAPMSGGIFNVDDYEFPAGVPFSYQVASYDNAGVLQANFTTAGINQDIAAPWLKSLARPYLNRPVVIQDVSDIGAPARVAVHEVVGRSAGIAVSDVRAGRQYTLSVVTEDKAASLNMRALVASGDPIFLQLPAAEEELVPTGYYAVGDVSRQLAMRRSPRRYWQLSLTEVAAPGADVVGAQVTWQTVVTTYTTWNQLITAKATWNDVLNIVAPATEVIVS